MPIFGDILYEVSVPLTRAILFARPLPHPLREVVEGGDNSGWVPCHDASSRNRFRHDRAGSDNTPFVNAHPRHDNSVSADEDVRADTYPSETISAPTVVSRQPTGAIVGE